MQEELSLGRPGSAAADFWTEADVISVYTRAQAIADGVLVAVGDMVPDKATIAKQAGWKIPVALTQAVAGLVRPNDRERSRGQDLTRRLWDLLNMARLYGRGQEGDTVLFQVLFWVSGRAEFVGAGKRRVTLKAVIHPGDNLEPVMTISLPNED